MSLFTQAPAKAATSLRRPAERVPDDFDIVVDRIETDEIHLVPRLAEETIDARKGEVVRIDLRGDPIEDRIDDAGFVELVKEECSERNEPGRAPEEILCRPFDVLVENRIVPDDHRHQREAMDQFGVGIDLLFDVAPSESLNLRLRTRNLRRRAGVIRPLRNGRRERKTLDRAALNGAALLDDMRQLVRKQTPARNGVWLELAAIKVKVTPRWANATALARLARRWASSPVWTRTTPKSAPKAGSISARDSFESG